MKRRGKLYTFIVCLLISFILWTLIKLSGEFSHTIEIPVTFKYPAKDKVMIRQSSNVFAITYKTEGFMIPFYRVLPRKKPVTIILTNTNLKHVQNGYKAEIDISRYYKLFAEKLNLNDNIIDISPDSLSLYLEDIYYKKVPVHINVLMHFEKQYQLYKQLKFEPDSVTISGVQKVIEKISYIGTELKELTGLKTNQFLNLNLKKPANANIININPETVNLFIPVEKYTEGKIQIPVNALKNLKHRIIKIYPENVELTYLVAIKDYNKITPSMFLAVIDYDSKEANNSNAKVKIINSPDFIKITKVKPENVEFILW